MKRITALLFLVLSIMLVFSTTVQAKAYDNWGINPQISDSPEERPYQEISENQYDEKIADELEKNAQFQKSELMDYRTEYSQVFQNRDGTLTEEIHSRPIFYKNEDGKLTKINSRVVKQNDGTYINAANAWKVRFAHIQKNTNIVSLSYMDYVFNMSLMDTKSVQVSKYKNQYEKVNLPEELVDNTTVVYGDVFENVDLSYTVMDCGIKENIIIKSYTGQTEFLFNIEAKNVQYKDNEYGDIIFFNKNGKEIFAIGGLYAIDANQNTTLDVKCSIEESTDGFYVLKTAIDEDFLANAAYPVIIDPTVTVYGASRTKDSFVGDFERDRNFNSGTNMAYLRTGRDAPYGARRTYISFNNPSLPSGSTIDSAVIKLYLHSSNGAINLRAYRVIASWNSATITWNNQPQNTTTDAGVGSSLSGGWYGMTVTNWVKAFVNGTASNYGFCIVDTNENNSNVWATWRSGDYSGDTYDPILRVNYTTSSVINKSVKIACEDIFRRDHSDYANIAVDILTQARTAFRTTFAVQLNPGTIYSFYNFPGIYCTRTKSQLCTHNIPYTCGDICDNSIRTPNHHKNAYRIHQTSVSMGTSGHNLSVLFADHYFCSANGGQIYGLGGGGDIKYALLDINHNYYDNIRLFQHEVSHCFGSPDGGDPSTCTPGQRCIMSGGYSGSSVATGVIWCDRCIGVFNPNRV